MRSAEGKRLQTQPSNDGDLRTQRSARAQREELLVQHSPPGGILPNSASQITSVPHVLIKKVSNDVCVERRNGSQFSQRAQQHAVINPHCVNNPVTGPHRFVKISFYSLDESVILSI